jgi:hypothetical protein
MQDASEMGRQLVAGLQRQHVAHVLVRAHDDDAAGGAVDAARLEEVLPPLQVGTAGIGEVRAVNQ